MSIQKIMVALVIALAVIGLTGIASASFYTETVISGSLFTSSSTTTVSNFPVEEQYESIYVAELRYSAYPPIDMSWTGSSLSGSTYTYENDMVSTPAGSETSSSISNTGDVSGSVGFWNCAMWGNNDPPQVIEIESGGSANFGWASSHPAGSAYQGYFAESTSVWWP